MPQSSVGDTDDERCLFHIGLSYDDHITKLENYYLIAHDQILQYQGSVLGLFPSSTIGTCQEGDVRESIYCAVALWALSQAYKRLDDDHGRCYELGQCAVKTMRGILYCWMKQADNVEQFKSSQKLSLALHSKFHIHSGSTSFTESDSLSPPDTNHLQIDCVALYLLYIVQMITSGLQIIYTTDEVNFIQNLVFYIERVYRTPDYGMWERGTKYNNGTAELNASSIGIAKAALESINGFNLFGDYGAAWSVVFVDIDAHNRNRTTFDTILPRESNSKNTDAALLAAVGWPSFAVHDQQLRHRTVRKVRQKLEGSYGFKRFFRDGYGTVLEDKRRRFYNSGEIKNFERVECDWPLFYIYMILEGIFQRDQATIDEYKAKLEPLIKHTKRGELIPRYYYVPRELIERERKNVGSQARLPCIESQQGGVFLWGQAVYLIAQILSKILW